MHDIDPMKKGYESELDALEADEFEFEFEFQDDDEEEVEELFEGESPFSEEEELELAAELLEITSDEELDLFLGKLFRKVKRGFKKFARSKVGRFLGGALKKVAKVALPIAGGAVGTFFGGPAGGMVGSRLGGLASRLFGRELEGLSPEDVEFEVARRFVRLAGTAARNVKADAPDPQGEVMKALTKAARVHAPGLVGSGGKLKIPAAVKSAAASVARQKVAIKKSGKWIRRGNRIILMGL